MKFSAPLSIMYLALGLGLYCVSVVIFRRYHGRAPNDLTSHPYHYYKDDINTEYTWREFSSRADHLRPPVRSDVSSKRDESCQWKVMVWAFPYRPKIQPGYYYCPETTCTVQYMYSSSYKDMEASDVVVLHGLGKWDTTKINSYRRRNQLLTFMTWERPTYYENKRPLSMFNWTMTYSYRSDFPIPYGRRIMKSELEIEKFDPQERNWAQGKTGLAIWIAFNCKSTEWPRNDFIYKLSTFMKIDKFGRCGTLPCGDERQDEKCLSKISSYKFYIAFENSSCEDYITEKMWRNAFEHDAVPIVYGAPKRDYERLAPRNSFIHISDFNNMSSLASYITLLDRNDSMYNSYFDWKSDYHTEFAKFPEVIDKSMLCSISAELVNLTGFSKGATSTVGNAQWFAKTCVNVTRPDMV